MLVAGPPAALLRPRDRASSSTPDITARHGLPPACRRQASHGSQPRPRQSVPRAASVEEVFREQRLPEEQAGPPPPPPLPPQQQQQQQQQHHVPPEHLQAPPGLGPPAAAGEGHVLQEEEQAGPGGDERDPLGGREMGASPSSREQRGVRNIRKEFGPAGGARYLAADDLNLSIPCNTLTALLGPSGSGKTTLLRMISGLEQPDQGQIFFNGVDVTQSSVKERNIGFVFQSYALFRHLTVAENITFGPRMRRMPINLDAKVRELLELVELEGYGGRLPRQLSGGQRQRIALARALAPDPQLLLLDEPFGALDPTVRAAVRQGFKEIIDRVGITSILVTHDQEEAFDIADQVAIFNRGRIVQVGTPDEVRRAPASPFVLDFIDDVNHLPANCLFIRKMGFQAGGKRWVMARPTGVRVFLEQPTQPATAPAEVTDVIDVGYAVKYTMQFDDKVYIEVHEKGEEACSDDNVLSITQRVYLHIPPADMMAFEYSELGARPE